MKGNAGKKAKKPTKHTQEERINNLVFISVSSAHSRDSNVLILVGGSNSIRMRWLLAWSYILVQCKQMLMFMFSNALGSEQGVILDRASECFFQLDEQIRAETTDLQQTESLWGSYCSVSCWVCARELLIQLYSLTDGCTKLHDIVQMLLFVSDSCIREKQSVPFPSTQPTCFPEPRVDFFSSCPGRYWVQTLR